MESWVRENLKTLSRKGALGKRATHDPVVLEAAHPKKPFPVSPARGHLEEDAPAEA